MAQLKKSKAVLYFGLLVTVLLVGGIHISGQDDLGVIAFWNFDEPGVTISNMAGGTWNGSTCGAQQVAGKQGLALQFDGIDDFAMIENDERFETLETFSVSSWIRVDQLPPFSFRNDFRVILGKPSLTTFSLVLEGSGKISGSVNINGSRRLLKSPEPVEVGKWIHAGFTFDGETGEMALYLDGEVVNSDIFDTGIIELEEAPVSIGASGSSSDDPEMRGGVRTFPGTIDEVQLYERVLSATEMKQLAQLPTNPSQPPERIPVVFEVLLNGQPNPVIKLVIQSDDGCPIVTFARPDNLANATTATAELELIPGIYSIALDLGNGFINDFVDLRFNVDPDALGLVEVPWIITLDFSKVQRAISTINPNPRARNYYSADHHMHTIYSGDGNIEIKSHVLANIAANLDLIMISDHDTGEGHLPLIEEANRYGMPYLLGEEVSTGSWGHLNVYSLDPGEFVDPQPGMTPDEFFAEARSKGATIIQVNHPFWGGRSQGYFNRMDDPDFSYDFDAVEVINGFNGEVDDRDQRAIETVFDMWNQGMPIIAVGGSDDHNGSSLTAQAGWPRTYVYVDEPLTTENYLKNLKAQRAFVTTGPLIYLTANGNGVPGSHFMLFQGETLNFNFELESVAALEALHVWHNGKQIQSFSLNGQTTTIEWSTLPSEGWYAVTVEAADGNFALTNPVWIDDVIEVEDLSD